MTDITVEAVGKWHGIYNALGIEVGNGKHCKCPMCGGKDRWRMDNKDGRGTFFCNHCGAGDGFKLVQMVLGCDFKGAAEAVEGVIGTVTTARNIPKEKIVSPEYLREIFTKSEKATEHCKVGSYLKNRGLSVVPECLRCHPGCHEPETNKKMPAMLAVFKSSDGTAITMHRTYLDGVGGKANIKSQKKILPALAPMAGGAIRLFEAEDMVAVAEGIETSLAVNESMNIPCWSVVSTAGMESFEPPKGIKTVVVCADNDKNFAGQKAAYVLANKLAIKGFGVSVMVPVKPGTDFLDELNALPDTKEMRQ